MIKNFLKVALFGAMLSASVAHAQYPDKQVNYIIPFGPGGESDITARYQQSFFKNKFGQDLIVEYKPGGGGAVGWSQLNKFAGDGYTWMGINLPHVVMQPLGGKVGYETDTLTPVYYFHFTPDALIVPADSPFKTVADMVAYAKANPGKVTLSGSGKASANNLAQIRFDGMADVKTTYVPFKGTGAAVAALLGNQVSGSWGYTSVGATQGKAVRMLAVAMDQRHPKFPDVPTFKELGFDLVSGAYRGIAVPNSTPEALRIEISERIDQINKDPAFRKRLEDDGMAMLDITYQKMPVFMENMKKTYPEAAKQAGLVK
jgi:tripartite-type tricarboxylate transporter receptor subunit TctC